MKVVELLQKYSGLARQHRAESTGSKHAAAGAAGNTAKGLQDSRGSSHMDSDEEFDSVNGDYSDNEDDYDDYGDESEDDDDFDDDDDDDDE
eukprot:scaffold232256_cov47-Prasinocladus_malaysianus.AAC.1